MRPASIRWFEGLNLLALATVIPGDYLVWDELSGAAGRAGENALATIVIVQGAIIAFELLIILMISRGRSRVFKWIYIVVVGLATMGTVIVIKDELQSRPLYATVLLVQAVLFAVALGLLFRRDSAEWFAGQDEVDPEIFR